MGFNPIIFSNSDSLKLGQTVIAWGGENQNSVSTGIISSLINAEEKTKSADNLATSTEILNTKIVAINTNNLADSVTGGPLLNLYGEVVGLRISTNISDKYNYLPSNIVKNEVANYAAVQ